MNALDIKNKRNILGYSQTKLAELLGVSKQTVINYEKGQVVPESKSKILYSVLNGNPILEQLKFEGKEVEIFSKERKSENSVPYYDIDFTSSFLEVTNNQNTKPDSYIDHPFFKGCDYVVRNSGQSMAKVICHGDAIGLVEVKNWREFFPYGEIYAIVTNDNLRMIKVISKGDTDEYYTLISKPTENKKDEFPQQQIKKNSILSIFRVQASSHLF